jgi:hypothetical protein
MSKSDRKRYPKNPLRNPTQKQLRSIFGDYDVVDATSDVTLIPHEGDFEQATQCDPKACGFARAARRTLGASAALVFNETAYFDHLGADGVRRIHRYKNSKGTKQNIKLFDRYGSDAVKQRSFVFRAPCRSYTIKEQRKKGKRLRASPRGQMLMDAWLTKKKMLDAERDLGNMTTRLEQLESKHTPQASTVVETKEQVRKLSSRLRELKQEHRDKKQKADKVRLRPYRPQSTNGTVHNLEVRNAVAA